MTGPLLPRSPPVKRAAPRLSRRRAQTPAPDASRAAPNSRAPCEKAPRARLRRGLSASPNAPRLRTGAGTVRGRRGAKRVPRSCRAPRVTPGAGASFAIRKSRATLGGVDRLKPQDVVLALKLV